MRRSIEALEAENARLREENAQLRQENSALRALLEKLRARVEILEKVKRQGPGDPPPTSEKAAPACARPKRPGPPAGHPGMSWSVPATEPRVVTLRLHGCPECGGRLTRYAETQDHVVVDLPEVRPEVTKYCHERGYCPRCKKTVRAPRAADEPPRGHLGMRTLALVAEWKTRLAVPYGKIAQVLRGFGLPVSRGALPACTQRVSEWLGPKHEALREMVRNTTLPVHPDETSWPVNGKNGWMWMFTTGSITVYVAEPTRSGKVAVAVLGKHRDGVVVSDFYAVYIAIHCLHQYCWAHLLREAKEIAALGDPAARRLYAGLAKTFKEADIVAQATSALAPEVLKQEYDRVDGMLTNLRRGASKNKDVERLKKRIRRHQESLLTFLNHPDVEPTNNRGERKIRPVVVARKVSGGSRSWPGARAHAVIMSCRESLDHWKTSFLDLVRQSACTPSQRKALESVVPA